MEHRRFEFEGWTSRGNRSHKFWVAETCNVVYRAKSGKIGAANPVLTERTFAFSWEAEEHLRRKIREKLYKGYDEVDTQNGSLFPEEMLRRRQLGVVETAPEATVSVGGAVPPTGDSDLAVSSDPFGNDNADINERFQMLEFD